MHESRVVLVSDSRRQQDQLLRKLLGKTPAALVEANSGRDCLDQVSRYQVRLVVVDGDPPDIKVNSLIRLLNHERLHQSLAYRTPAAEVHFGA